MFNSEYLVFSERKSTVCYSLKYHTASREQDVKEASRVNRILTAAQLTVACAG